MHPEADDTSAGERVDPATAVIGSLIALVVFFPHLTGNLLRVIAACVGLAVLAVESARTEGAGYALRRIGLGALPATAVVMAGAMLWQRALGEPDYAMNLERLFVIVPLWFYAGRRLFAVRVRVRYARVLVLWAVVVALLALVEHFTARSVLGVTEEMQRYTRDGFSRALVGAQHPLVLGTTLAGAIPLLRAARIRAHMPSALVLLAGTWATGSRGATAVGVVVVCLQAADKSVELVKRARGLIVGGAMLGLCLLAWMSFVVWKPVIASETAGGYSSQYRTALYALLPGILRAAPLGYGMGSLPQGQWVVTSQLYGGRDLSATVDSEVVYAALSLGVLGVGLYVAAVLVAANGIGRDYAAGMAALVVTGLGAVLALHAWDSLGPFWYLLLGGASIALFRTRSPGEDVVAPRRRRHEGGRASPLSRLEYCGRPETGNVA